MVGTETLPRDPGAGGDLDPFNDIVAGEDMTMDPELARQFAELDARLAAPGAATSTEVPVALAPRPVEAPPAVPLTPTTPLAPRPMTAPRPAAPVAPPAPRPVPIPISRPTPAPAPAPSTPESTVDDTDTYKFNADSLKLHVGELSQSVVTSSQEHAMERINEETTRGKNRFTRFIKKVWHGNLGREVYEQRYDQQGRARLAEGGPVNNNLLALSGGSQEDSDRARAAVIERIANGYLHGEHQSDLVDVAGGDLLQAALKKLVKDYASGRIDDDALIQERSRALTVFGKKLHESDRNKGLALADNIVEVAKHAKAAFNHGIGLERIDAALGVKYTEAKMGARSEAHYSGVSRAMDKLYKLRIGKFHVGTIVNETTLAVAVSGVAVFGKLAAKKATSAALRFASLGAGSAVIAGMREARTVKQERATHAREMAYGGGEALSLAGKRRERMETTRYSTVAASELISDLATARERAGDSKADLQSAIDAITHARTRISLSDTESIDLIHYTHKTRVEEERLSLDLRIAEARAAVKKALATADHATLVEIGAVADDGTILNLDTILQRRAEAADGLLQEIRGDMSAKDRAFQTLRNKRVAGAAALAFVTSETIGLGIQELGAEVRDSLQGVFEQNSGENRQTLLAAAFRNAGQPSGNGNTVTIGATAAQHVPAVHVPAGYSLKESGGGKWELFNTHNQVVDNNITFDANGHLSEASKQALTAKGFHIPVDKSSSLPDTYPTTTSTMSAEDFVNANPNNQLTHIHLDGWYDENTPQPDLNELRLDWGGVDGSGIDADGNYVFSVAGMTPDGSFHGDLSANAQELIRNGQMKMALSLTQGTQSHVVMVDINSHGQAIIPKGSFAGQNLFTNQGGQAHFIGAYADAVQMGQMQNGVQHVYSVATVVGSDQVHNVTATTTTTLHHNLVTTTLVPPPEAPPVVEVPPVVPIRARSGLEGEAPPPPPREPEAPRTPERVPTPEQPAPEEDSYGYYARGAYSAEARKRYAEYRSPRLNADPHAKLNMGEEVDWYLGKIRTEPGGAEYLDELAEKVRKSPELRDLGHDKRVIDCIPVDAVGEADNIYGTLSLYAQQPEKHRDQLKLLLHVNWRDKAEKDPDGQLKIQKTLDDIARARRDFPDLDIATVETVWDSEKYDGKPLIYYAVSMAYDAAFIAVDDAVKSGVRASDDDILFLRNDADPQGMDSNYIGRYVNAADKNPDKDAFVSATRQGTAEHSRYPGFGLSANMREVIDQTKHLLHKEVSTIGTNSAARASMLAAVGCIHRRPDAKGYMYTGAGSDDLEVGYRIHDARSGRSPAEVRTMSAKYRYGLSPALAAVSGAGDDGTGSSGGGTRALPDAKRSPIGYVIGAHIDASPDRMLNTYANRQPITRSWSGFDAGGHTGRTSVFGGRHRRPLRGENVRDGRGIAQRVAKNYTEMFNTWAGGDPDVIRMSLALMHGQGPDIYNVTWKEGRADFRFTPKGEKWLATVLEGKDEKGNPDPFGSRVRRQLYHDRGVNTDKVPASKAPRFVRRLT